jgi:hypothetical protein
MQGVHVIEVGEITSTPNDLGDKVLIEGIEGLVNNLVSAIEFTLPLTSNFNPWFCVILKIPTISFVCLHVRK